MPLQRKVFCSRLDVLVRQSLLYLSRFLLCFFAAIYFCCRFFFAVWFYFRRSSCFCRVWVGRHVATSKLAMACLQYGRDVRGSIYLYFPPTQKSAFSMYSVCWLRVAIDFKLKSCMIFKVISWCSWLYRRWRGDSQIWRYFSRRWRESLVTGATRRNSKSQPGEISNPDSTGKFPEMTWE